MEFLTSFPIIPIVTFILIAGFFAYQLQLYMKERKKAQTPSVPSLGKAPLHDNSAQFVARMTAASAPKAPVHKKLAPVNKALSGAIVVLLLVSSVGFFYVFQNNKLGFVPRANIEPTSPLMPLTPSVAQPTLEPMPTAETVSELSPTVEPTSSLLALNTTPLLSPTTSLAPTTPLSPTIAPTRTPTTALPTTTTTTAPSIAVSPSPTSTLLAYYNTNVYPTSTPTPTPEEETPTPKSGATATPKPKNEIPKAGLVSVGSIMLLAGSIVLLTLGFAL